MSVFEFEPIGTVHCAARSVDEVVSEGLPASVLLHADYLPALQGIEVGDHLYVMAIFDQADGSQMSGSTGTSNEQGAFSIRSSCRPNRIGLTLSRVTAISGARISFEWLDFSDGTPVVDLKRYNWRWECVLSARRLDRRFIERQIDPSSLRAVLMRPAANFHGEVCDWVVRAAALGASLIQDRTVWLGDPNLVFHVHGSGHLIDAIQGITGATLGNGRLILASPEGGPATVVLAGSANVQAQWSGTAWEIL